MDSSLSGQIYGLRESSLWQSDENCEFNFQILLYIKQVASRSEKL